MEVVALPVGHAVGRRERRGRGGEARDAGDLRSDIDPRIVERLLFGMINSIVEWYRPEGPESAAQLARDVLAVAAHGIRMPRAASGG